MWLEQLHEHVEMSTELLSRRPRSRLVLQAACQETLRLLENVLLQDPLGVLVLRWRVTVPEQPSELEHECIVIVLVRIREYALPWRLGRQHLDHRAAERPDVTLLPVRLGTSEQHLRRDPLQRATEGGLALPRLAVSHKCILQLLAAAEVDELALAVIVEQHVVTFEVAVHEPSSMEVDQAVENLAHVLSDHGDRQALLE